MKRAGWALLLAACGYSSQYTPPLDGRARPRWVENHVENNVPSLPPGCADEIAWLTQPEWRAQHRLAVDPVVVTAVWVVHPLPPLPAPHLPPPIGWRPVGAHFSGRDSFDPDPLRKIGIALAVIAAPITAVVLATVRPELDDRVLSIDQVNAYNDLARSAGTQCSSWSAP